MIPAPQVGVKGVQKKKSFKPRDFFPGWNFLEYLFLRVASEIVNAFPIEISSWIARRVGDLLFFLMTERRKIAFDNLDIAFGNTKTTTEKRRIARESFRHLTTSLMEFFRIPKILKGSERRFRFQGAQYTDQAFAKGKGVLLVISHLGSWELLAFLPYLKKYPCSVVGRSMKNPYIYQWIQSLRRSTTLNHIDKKSAAKAIFSELKKNHLVAILIDQWAGAEGLWTDFFGEPTSTTSIPARFARKTGCALVPACCLRIRSGQYLIQIKPEIPFPRNAENWEEQTTQELNRELEEQIAVHPEQWSWAHRRWKSTAHYRAIKN